jgi:hypothetical protein
MRLKIRLHFGFRFSLSVCPTMVWFPSFGGVALKYAVCFYFLFILFLVLGFTAAATAATAATAACW